LSSGANFHQLIWYFDKAQVHTKVRLYNVRMGAG
jgi:hypothetical protein